ncbi:skin secretory protein xP2-like [Artibeus jamaicensis]|uniref:skin secretory protein xP2-like n=1 Tax=Artibeus jamaicensis TaxID=9417 RepID=UPI00235AA77E|nr:skin secretory protein xP2-like [Artibeus jamaicensis]
MKHHQDFSEGPLSRSIPGPVWGFASPPGRRDLSPPGVSSFPRPDGKGLLSHGQRGGSRGAPEGGVVALPALPGRPGQQGPGGRGSAPPSLATVAAAPLLAASRPVRSLRAWGSPRCHLLGSSQSGLPRSQKADGQCQGSARARARLGSAAGPGSSPASAPHSEPLPLPRPPGRRRGLPARVKEERAARGCGPRRGEALRPGSGVAALPLPCDPATAHGDWRRPESPPAATGTPRSLHLSIHPRGPPPALHPEIPLFAPCANCQF